MKFRRLCVFVIILITLKNHFVNGFGDTFYFTKWKPNKIFEWLKLIEEFVTYNAAQSRSSHYVRLSTTHLLQRGTDIRTIQQLLGHKDIATTMIYTHVLQQGGYGVKSPLDDLNI